MTMVMVMVIEDISQTNQEEENILFRAYFVAFYRWRGKGRNYRLGKVWRGVQ